MLNKKLLFVAMLSAGFTATVQAGDEVHHLNFKEAVDRAVADGTLDGSVKFYLKGTKSGGKVIQKDAVTNKKTNGFGKSAATSCDWVLRSALIQMQNNAKAQGANAVTNIVSYFKANETTSTTTYDCYKGTMMAGVALKGDVVKF
ncbi:excinuclease [Acinetobacter pittii]|uniref:excinuclease n=1 Tax=Acinetobacter calcoaceticus/baumannii complex TaxID=909768 RepID=UPI000B3608DC|nr:MULTISPECIES: excinuclease [Acinetobacter calcoaceticus/baumannii complex]MCG9492748.1 excinuclease [Acinetobacter pittii]MCU4347938.1 excinuclease [Acinetobacter lactucae]